MNPWGATENVFPCIRRTYSSAVARGVQAVGRSLTLSAIATRIVHKSKIFNRLGDTAARSAVRRCEG